MKSPNTKTFLILRFICGCIDMYIAWFWLSRNIYVITILALLLAIRDLTPITAFVMDFLKNILKN